MKKSKKRKLSVSGRLKSYLPKLPLLRKSYLSPSTLPRRREPPKTRVAPRGFGGERFLFYKGVIRESTRDAKAWNAQANRPLLNKDKICDDRKTRRNVLFKSGFAGKGKVRFAKWTNKSKVRCS